MNKLAIGEFSIIELLKHHKDNVIKIFVKSKKEEEKYIKYNVPIFINENYINKLVKKEDIYALAEFIPYESKLDNKSTHIIINNLNDEGELGTIIRTAVAFSYFNIALINSNIDIFSSKLIRASTGAIFLINIEKFNSKKEYQKIYKNKIIEFINKDAPLSLEVGAKLYSLKSK